MTLERLVELKHSTRMELADRVLDELIDAARRSGDPAASRAADALADWDRQANADSTGVLLFTAWVQAANPQDPFLYDLFATPADPAAPLTTPAGLADPEEAVRALVVAAGQVEAVFGRLDVPWGKVARMRRGSVDEPANGFPGDPLGVFRALLVDVSTIRPDAPASVVGGETFIAAVEFGDPVRARVLTTYGNASQSGSPHVGDQLVLAARGELRPAWRSRSEVESHLEMRERLTVNGASPVSTPVP
jgi:acyl-homoserine-lactone acylase